MSFWMLIVYILIALLSLAILFIRRRLSYWKCRGIPCDQPSFPGGNVTGSCHISENIGQNYRKFKKSAPFGGFLYYLHPAVVLSDLDLIKDVLIKDFHNFTERGLFHNERDDPLSGHLFRLNEQKWKHLRSQLSPSFSVIKLKDMFPAVLSVGEKFLKTFDKKTKKSSIFNVNDVIARYVTDVNGTCVFGLDCNSLNDGSSEFFNLVESMFRLKCNSKIANGFIASFPKLAQKLRMRQIHKTIQEFFIRIVRETSDYREKSSAGRSNDFLTFMLELKSRQGDLTLEEITGQVFAYFFAGFHNCTAMIELTLYELALNQDVQDTLRSEIASQMEKYDEKLTFECVREMSYLKKVIKEVLRKYPIIPHLMRLAKNDYQNPHSRYTIPRGCMVLIPIRAIQNDPEIFPEPEKFDPERFRQEEIEKRHTAAWLPFGQGARHCVGLRYAKMQVYVPLILLIRNYKFQRCNETPTHVEMDPEKMFLGVKGGIYLHVERI